MNCPKCNAKFQQQITAMSVRYCCGSIACHDGQFIQSTECRLREELSAMTAKCDRLAAELKRNAERDEKAKKEAAVILGCSWEVIKHQDTED